MWTDPPYGVAYVGKTKDALRIANDDLGLDALRDNLLRPALALAWNYCRTGAPWYVAAPSGPQFLAFAQTLTELKVWRQTLIWKKDRFVMGRSDYHYKHEAIFAGEGGALQDAPANHPAAEKITEFEHVTYGWKDGEAHPWLSDRKQNTVLEIETPKASREHPTMKPTALIRKCLDNSLRRGGIVIDPFGGSGSTLIAAEQAGWESRLIELSPIYCDVIVTRWENATGQTAVRPTHG